MNSQEFFAWVDRARHVNGEVYIVLPEVGEEQVNRHGPTLIPFGKDMLRLVVKP